MRKWLTTAGYTATTLLAILILLPLLMGMLAEKKLNSFVEIINSSTPFHLKITDYRRSWFTSKATAEIKLNKLETANPQLNYLIITANITHGPVIMDWLRFRFIQSMINADINLNSAQNNILKREPNAPAIATARIKFRLNGNTDTDLDSPPLAYQDQEINLRWQGLKIEAFFSNLYNKTKSKISFAGVNFVTKDYNFHLAGITSIYQGEKKSSGLWLGERNLQINSFATKNTDSKLTAIEGLDIHNTITADQNNTTNLATKITINNLNLNGTVYEQTNLDLEINKLGQDSLFKLQQQLALNKNIPSPQIGMVFDAIIALLNNGSEINIKQLSTTTPWGKLIAIIKIVFANQPNNGGLLATITNSTVHTDIKTDRTLALHLLEKFYQNKPGTPQQQTNPTHQAESLLNAWQQSQKITVSEHDHYLHVLFDYKNNQIAINNKQLVLTTKP